MVGDPQKNRNVLGYFAKQFSGILGRNPLSHWAGTPERSSPGPIHPSFSQGPSDLKSNGLPTLTVSRAGPHPAPPPYATNEDPTCARSTRCKPARGGPCARGTLRALRGGSAGASWMATKEAGRGDGRSRGGELATGSPRVTNQISFYKPRGGGGGVRCAMRCLPIAGTPPGGQFWTPTPSDPAKFL